MFREFPRVRCNLTNIQPSDNSIHNRSWQIIDATHTITNSAWPMVLKIHKRNQIDECDSALKMTAKSNSLKALNWHAIGLRDKHVCSFDCSYIM